MKKITLFITLLSISLVFSQNLPYDFETSPVTADYTGFDGATPTVEAVSSPQSTGNTSTKLLKIVRNGGQTWAGAFTITATDLDFTTNKFITAKVWTSAPIGTKIMLKTENETTASNNSGEKNFFTTKTGEWETIVFDFTGVTNANQNKLVLIPNNGTLGDGSATSTYYFDDFEQVATSPVTPLTKSSFPIDAETAIETLGGFDGGTPSIEAVAAPQSTGNTSTKLIKLIRDGGQIWAGAAIELEDDLDYTTKKFITTRIWTTAPIGTLIMVKTENADNASENSGEINVNTTKSGEWETLVFDMTTGTNVNVNQNKLVFIPNNGTLGDGSAASTFYFDDFQNVNEVTASTASFTAGQFEVYPNPTQNVWNIKATQVITAVQVYDVLGKQVLANNYDGTSVELNASSLKSGLYFAKVNTAQGVQTLKLVKK